MWRATDPIHIIKGYATVDLLDLVSTEFDGERAGSLFGKKPGGKWNVEIVNEESKVWVVAEQECK